MGSVPAELSLDLRPTFVPKTISDFFYDVSKITNASERFLKVDDFLKRLQEEMRKIDAFKRELPLCMILLNDGSLSFSLIDVSFCKANSSSENLDLHLDDCCFISGFIYGCVLNLNIFFFFFPFL